MTLVILSTGSCVNLDHLLYARREAGGLILFFVNGRFDVTIQSDIELLDMNFMKLAHQPEKR